MQKYVYFEPKGGLNDILSCIERCIIYCNTYNRILLVNGLKSCYNINFADYFDIPSNNNIILDIDQIKNICCNSELTVYPNLLQNKMNDILENKINFNYFSSHTDVNYRYKNIDLYLPNKNIEENLIIYGCCGGGDGYKLFKQIIFKQNIMNICKERYKMLNKPYLGIQIRNTDYKCNYEDFFEKNKVFINSYKEIYLATDDIHVLQFFREKGLQLKNFTTYSSEKYCNLHKSKVDPNTKFIDVISDIFILSMSNKLISPSKGGFIKLIKSVKNNEYFKE